MPEALLQKQFLAELDKIEDFKRDVSVTIETDSFDLKWFPGRITSLSFQSLTIATAGISISLDIGAASDFSLEVLTAGEKSEYPNLDPEVFDYVLGFESVGMLVSVAVVRA